MTYNIVQVFCASFSAGSYHTDWTREHTCLKSEINERVINSLFINSGMDRTSCFLVPSKNILKSMLGLSYKIFYKNLLILEWLCTLTLCLPTLNTEFMERVVSCISNLRCQFEVPLK